MSRSAMGRRHPSAADAEALTLVLDDLRSPFGDVPVPGVAAADGVAVAVPDAGDEHGFRFGVAAGERERDRVGPHVPGSGYVRGGHGVRPACVVALTVD